MTASVKMLHQQVKNIFITDAQIDEMLADIDEC